MRISGTVSLTLVMVATITILGTTRGVHAGGILPDDDSTPSYTIQQKANLPVHACFDLPVDQATLFCFGIPPPKACLPVTTTPDDITNTFINQLTEANFFAQKEKCEVQQRNVKFCDGSDDTCPLRLCPNNIDLAPTKEQICADKATYCQATLQPCQSSSDCANLLLPCFSTCFPCRTQETCDNMAKAQLIAPAESPCLGAAAHLLPNIVTVMAIVGLAVGHLFLM